MTPNEAAERLIRTRGLFGGEIDARARDWLAQVLAEERRHVIEQIKQAAAPFEGRDDPEAMQECHKALHQVVDDLSTPEQPE